MLPFFRKSEGLAPCDEIVIDAPAHNSEGPLGVCVRSPVLSGAREFVEAAGAAGIPRGDYDADDVGLSFGFQANVALSLTPTVAAMVGLRGIALNLDDRATAGTLKVAR